MSKYSKTDTVRVTKENKEKWSSWFEEDVWDESTFWLGQMVKAYHRAIENGDTPEEAEKFFKRKFHQFKDWWYKVGDIDRSGYPASSGIAKSDATYISISAKEKLLEEIYAAKKGGKKFNKSPFFKEVKGDHSRPLNVMRDMFFDEFIAKENPITEELIKEIVLGMPYVIITNDEDDRITGNGYRSSGYGPDERYDFDYVELESTIGEFINKEWAKE